MSKPNKCPPHLRLVVSRLQDYIGHHPKGIALEDLPKLAIFAKQNKKDRAAALAFLEETEVVYCERDGSTCDWIYHHSKHWVPKIKTQSQMGEQLMKLKPNPASKIGEELLKIEPAEPLPPENLICYTCGRTKPWQQFPRISPAHTPETCSDCLDKLKAETTANQTEKDDEMSLTLDGLTPEKMRELARNLEKQAAAAEKRTSNKDEFNKQVRPLIDAVVQANGTAQRKFDEFVDAMAAVGTAVQALNNFKAE